MKFPSVFSIIIATFCFYRSGYCYNPRFDVFDIAKSGRDIGLGLIKSPKNEAPLALGVFDASKQMLLGYPLQAMFSALNLLCSQMVGEDAVKPSVPLSNYAMSFQLITPCKKYMYPMHEAEKMVENENFILGEKVVVLASGWITEVNETGESEKGIIESVAKAYHCRGNVNFLAIDVGSAIKTLYSWSALNTEKIGEIVAEGLARLTTVVPDTDIHLIGHSLGAQIMGAAGRHYYSLTQRLLPRITGLDPAKPCFNEGETLQGLQRGDAYFIDVIHTDWGVLGVDSSLGDIDFYPGGENPLAPGCFTASCAHQRAWQYYAESVYPGNERNFMAVRCNSMLRVRDHKCSGRKYPMGYATPHYVKGNYFLEVNSESPFGLEAQTENMEAADKCQPCQID